MYFRKYKVSTFIASKNILKIIFKIHLNLKLIQDILKIIEKIKTKAIGSDSLNITLTIFCYPYIVQFITHILNEFMIKSYFPMVWKQAIISPLPKINNPTELSHFRSISILPTLSKVMERVLERQIQSHNNTFDILPAKQSGFRAEYSCPPRWLT